MKTWLSRLLTAAFLLAPGAAWATCAPINPYQVVPGGTTPCTIADGGALAAAAAIASGAVQAAGGNASATLVTPTNGIAPVALADLANRTYDVRNAGGICDGNSHPLSSLYPTLSEAQGVYNLIAVTSLTQEIDWASAQTIAAQIQAGLVSTTGLLANIGAKLLLPHGVCVWGTSTTAGTDYLTINNASLHVGGDGKFQSLIKIYGDGIHFGLNNGMSVSTSSVASTGGAYVTGDTLGPAPGTTCVTPFQLTAASVDVNGALLAVPTIVNAGNCTPPANPLTVIDNTPGSAGAGSQFTATWTGTALMSLKFAGTGLLYQNGDVLSGPNGFQIQVTNQVGGAIQAGGYTYLNRGSMGTPPSNPVSLTGGSGSGASLNFNSFNNVGGSIQLTDFGMIEGAPGGIGIVSQHDIAPTSNDYRSLYFGVASNAAYFTKLMTITGGDNVFLDDVVAYNTLNVGGALAGIAGIEIDEAPWSIGRYQYTFNRLSIVGFDDCVRFVQNGNNPMQGIYAYSSACGQGTNMFDFINHGTGSIGRVVLDGVQSQNDGWLLTATNILGLQVTHADVIYGNGHSLAIGSTCGGFNLQGSVGQVIIHDSQMGTTRNNGCPDVSFVTQAGGNSTFHDNQITNQGGLPAMLAYNFLSTSNNNLEHDDLILGGLLSPPITDAGTSNRTMLATQVKSLGTSASIVTPSGPQLVANDNGVLPRFQVGVSAGGYGAGAQLYPVSGVAPLSITTLTDTPPGQGTITLTTGSTVPGNTQLITGASGLATNTVVKSSAGSVITVFPAPTGDIPAGTVLTATESAGVLSLSGSGPAGYVWKQGAGGANLLSIPLASAGGVAAIPDGIEDVNIGYTSLQATGSIQLPPHPFTGQCLHVQFYSTITALSWTNYPGNSGTVTSLPTTGTPTSPFAIQYQPGLWKPAICA